MERCPYLKTIQAGDESMDFCEIKLRPRQCLGECEVYNDFLKHDLIDAIKSADKELRGE